MEEDDKFVDIHTLEDEGEEIKISPRSSSKPVTKSQETDKLRTQADLKRFLGDNQIFDIDEKSYHAFFLCSLLLLFFYFLRGDNVETFLLPITFGFENIIGHYIYAAAIYFFAMVKFLFPLWILLIFREYPIRPKTIHHVVLNYLYIDTFNKVTYRSNTERVRIFWDRIRKVKHGQSKNFEYLELYDDTNRLLGCIRLDYNKMNNFWDTISFLLRDAHPLKRYHHANASKV